MTVLLGVTENGIALCTRYYIHNSVICKAIWHWPKMGVTSIIFVLVYLGSVIGGDQFGFVNLFWLKEVFLTFWWQEKEIELSYARNYRINIKLYIGWNVTDHLLRQRTGIHWWSMVSMVEIGNRLCEN